MKKYFALIVILLAVSVFAQTAEELVGKQQGNDNAFARNWLANYESIIWIAAMIMVIFVALLYFAGHFLQNEQIKQLGKTELMQAGMTVLIVGVFLGFVGFVDATLNYTAGQIETPCLDSTFAISKDITTLNKYSACYVNNLHKMAVGTAKGALRESVDAASKSYTNVGGQSDTVWLGYLGYSSRPNAHLRLDSEIKRLEFSTLSGFITSLNAQADFLGKIIPIFGPAAILLGLILRSFFFTRKLGGLLLATGFSLMIVMPAMYLLAWYTLQVQAFGPQAIEDKNDLCPDSCKVLAPWGYDTAKNDGKTLAMGIKTEPEAYGVYSMAGYNKLVTKRVEDEKPYISANDGRAWYEKEGIQLCNPKTDIGAIKAVDSQNCVEACRVFPMEAGLNCNETACDKIPLACKVVKPMTENDIDKYCNEDDENSEFYCNCPDFCEIDLPQVKKSFGEADNPTNIVPTKNANDFTGVETGKFDCTKCPSQCRAYVSDVEPLITTHDGQGNICDTECEKCMKQKTDDSRPDLMYGIPSIRSTRCDDPNACGLPMTIKKAKEGGITNLCPIECRINFETGETDYKDPVFLKECEGTFKDACKKCSPHCKINASVILETSEENSCYEPPKYYLNGEESDSCSSKLADICKMDKKINYNCARCPEPCRYVNPESINYKIGIGLLLSSSHYYQQCIYSSAEITCDVPHCDNLNFKDLPGSWKGCLEIDVPPDEQVCSPYDNVYKLITGQSETCPPYIFPPKRNTNLDSIEKALEAYNLQRPLLISGEDGRIVASIQANPNVAAVCANDDSQTYCREQYCEESKCKVDRAVVGPKMCNIDITDEYSQIGGNDIYCDGCYELNPGKTLGPQCQVYLSWGGEPGAEGILPAGCDSSCYPDTADWDENTKDNCVGFCYPRLIVPSNSECENYDATSAGDVDRIVADCSACPIDCRYDYKINANGKAEAQISEDAAKKCGLKTYKANGDLDENYGIVDAHNCDLRCRGRVAPQSAGLMITNPWTERQQNFYTYCNSAENYDCSDSTSASNGIWVRDVPYDQTNLGSPSSCYYNVVANGSSKWKYKQDTDTAPNCPDEENDGEGDGECDNNWYDPCPGLISYTYKAITSYRTCTPESRYEGIDDFINEENGLTGTDEKYYECGTINSQNTQFNLCGKVGRGSYEEDACSNSCDAQYNARAVECLEAEYYTPESGSLGTSPNIDSEDNCNKCPYFCRPADSDGVSICDKLNDDTLFCSSPNQCDLRRTQTDDFANPIGYCSIGLENLHLDASNPVPDIGSDYCAYKQPDEAACPLRCRIVLAQGEISTGCDGGDVGNACDSLNYECKLELPDSPCLSCSFCGLEQCTQKPRVWTDCSLCSPENFNAGATMMNPSDLVSSLSGAKATNTAWRTIGALGVPAIVLPILGIITTLAFIRSLSPLLGGDIEIPGLMKLI